LPVFGLIAAPFSEPILVFNILVVILTWCTAFGGWWLARTWGVSMGWAVAAGTALAFSPCRTAFFTFGHINLVSVLTFVPALYYLVQVTHPATRRYQRLAALALFGFWGVVTVLFDWVPAALLLFLGFWTLALQGLQPPMRQRPFLTLSLLIGLVLGIHFYCLLAVDTTIGLYEIRQNTARISHLFTPSVLLAAYDATFWSDWNLRWFESWWLANRIIFIGFSLAGLLFAVVGWQITTGFRRLHKPRNAYRQVVGVLGCAAILCCFPVVFLPDFFGGGKPIEFFLPSAILHAIPVLEYHRCPSRIGIIIPFLATLWVGLTVRQKLLNGILGWLLTFGISIEYLPKPLATITYEPNQAVWWKLAERPGGKLLNLPVFWRDGTRTIGHYWSAPILYQPVHQQTLICGYQSRVADSVFTAFGQSPVLRQVLAHQQHDTSTAGFSAADQQAFEHWARPTVVLMDTGLFNQRNTQWWLQNWNFTGWKEHPVNPPYRLWIKE
jgi:hypothetical protein